MRDRPGPRHASDASPSARRILGERAPVVVRAARRVTRDGASPLADPVLVEEPLEVRLDGAPVAVIMRTPGADFALAAGFLLGEGLLTGPSELAGVAWCRPAGEAGATNVVSVATHAGDGAARVGDRARRVHASSACGLCGRTTLEEVSVRIPAAGRRPAVDPERLLTAVVRLDAGQAVFRRTGASHAAAVVGPGGEVATACEDVGRHNAVDKCVGTLALREELPLPDHLLVVSGRVGFEIVQKALVAGFAGVCGIGGTTSLAVELAEAHGLLLAAFARDGRCNVYAGALAHVSRTAPEAGPHAALERGSP